MEDSVSYHFAAIKQSRQNRQKIEYHLKLRQQPKQSRMCGVGEKADRRPIDPPPIVQLRVNDPNLPSTDRSSYLQNPYYFMYASLMAADLDEELHLLRDGKTRSTTGSVVSSLYHLKDIDNSDAGFFVFPDLSVRVEGNYRLKLSLFEIIGKDVFHCVSIISDVFIVYSAKKFPGMEESTFLSRAFADQGLKIRIRKELRRQRRRLSRRKDSDEFDTIYSESENRKRPRDGDDDDDSFLLDRPTVSTDQLSEASVLSDHSPFLRTAGYGYPNTSTSTSSTHPTSVTDQTMAAISPSFRESLEDGIAVGGARMDPNNQALCDDRGPSPPPIAHTTQDPQVSPIPDGLPMMDSVHQKQDPDRSVLTTDSSKVPWPGSYQWRRGGNEQQIYIPSDRDSLTKSVKVPHSPASAPTHLYPNSGRYFSQFPQRKTTDQSALFPAVSTPHDDTSPSHESRSAHDFTDKPQAPRTPTVINNLMTQMHIDPKNSEEDSPSATSTNSSWLKEGR
ncbi:velvet factor-domain-containing protein [Fennellomyces sp. T-0311]|nr:velvet factor-domain-containing protein [Fennellomyces sp. T-0311]